jgi:hypothetical protein
MPRRSRDDKTARAEKDAQKRIDARWSINGFDRRNVVALFQQ